MTEVVIPDTASPGRTASCAPDILPIDLSGNLA